MDDAAVNLFDPAVQACPFEAYRELRDAAPVYRMPDTGYYVVTRYEDLRAIMRDPESFSSDPAIAGADVLFRSERARRIFETRGFPRVTPFSSDPPYYNHIRKIVDTAFQESLARADGMIREVIIGLVDAWRGRTTIDFLNDFCEPLPMTIITAMLGLPQADVPLLRDYSDAWAAPFSHGLSEAEEVSVAERSVDFQHYLADWLRRKRTDPQDDMLSILANRLFAGERPLTEAEASVIACVLVTGGNETTTSALAMAMRAMIEAGFEDRLRGDPRAIRIFVEEALRLHAPTQGLWRYTTREVALHGVTIPAGRIVHIRFGAANRDERHFPHPDEIDLSRKNAGSHFSFNQGLHHCPGAPLSRRELQMSFEVLLDRLRNLRLAPGQEQAEYRPNLSLRALTQLHLSFAWREGVTQ